MKGCLVPLLGGLGALLLLPGACFMAMGPGSPGVQITYLALGLIVVAVALAVFWRGD